MILHRIPSRKAAIQLAERVSSPISPARVSNDQPRQPRHPLASSRLNTAPRKTRPPHGWLTRPIARYMRRRTDRAVASSLADGHAHEC